MFSVLLLQSCCRFAHTLLIYTAEVLEFFQPITKACYFWKYTNYVIVGGVKITIKAAKHSTSIFWIKKRNPVAMALICYNHVWNQKWCCLLALMSRAEICMYSNTCSYSFSAACPFSPLNISRQTAWRKWKFVQNKGKSGAVMKENRGNKRF